MEARKITIVSTKRQEKSVIMSDATTLEELKRDLDKANIDYEGMVFYEGVSKTELIYNNSVLPSNIPYRGQTTNELVFMLTNPNKKIKSGAMNRKEIYALIKKHNLQKACLENYKKDYTRCKSEDLLKLIEYSSCTSNKQPVEMVDPNIRLIKEVEGLIKSVDLLLQTLQHPHVINNSDNIKSGEINSSYSDAEIDEMFDFV